MIVIPQCHYFLAEMLNWPYKLHIKIYVVATMPEKHRTTIVHTKSDPNSIK